MKKERLHMLAFLFALSICCSPVHAGIHDPVESADGWNIITGGGFTTATGGLTPVESNRFFYAQTSSSGLRGVWKYFPGDSCFTEGIYRVKFSVGSQSNFAFVAENQYVMILMADVNNDGIYQYDERIHDGRTVVAEPVPAPGTWTEWEHSYSITSATKTVGGDPVLGHRIGFVILANLDNSGFAFDRLSIRTAAWTPASPGGAGFTRGPAISPHHPKLLLCGNDMGGVFRSGDAGKTWTMVPFTELKCPVSQASYPQRLFTFHPAEEKKIFSSTINGFYKSLDAGETWQAITNGISAGERGPRVVAFDPSNPDFGLAVYDAVSTNRIRLIVTGDAGESWASAEPFGYPEDGVVNLCFSLTTNHVTVFLATTNAVFRSADNGLSWSVAEQGLPASDLVVYDMVAAEEILYLTCQNATNAIGIFRADGTNSWTRVAGNGLYTPTSISNQYQRLAVCRNSPDDVYVTYAGSRSPNYLNQEESNIFKSRDGGTTWRPVLFQHPGMTSFNVINTSWLTGEWGWANPALTVDVCANNPDFAIAGTITSVYVTENGGDSWRQVHAPDGIKTSQPSGGILSMTCYNYYFDPHNHKNRFLASGDFSGFSSRDAGQTWSYSNEGNPWPHDIYAVAFSPVTSNRLWTGCSVQHDIPFWSDQVGLGTYVGGVVASQDGGAIWSPVDVESVSGLPRYAVTDIWCDPQRSAVNAEVLWAAIPGHGIFLSEDGGENWVARNTGLAANNLNILRVVGNESGTLYALSTVKKNDGGPTVPGALYRSTNQGASWTMLRTDSANPFLTNLTLVPGQTNTLYISALQATASVSSRNGGVWKSSDGGSTWTEIFTDPAFSLAVQPGNPERLFVSSWFGLGDGIYTSSNGGSDWERLKLFPYRPLSANVQGEDYPFWRPLQIVFHPADRNLIYVTNFGGGVYKGVINN